MLTLPRRMLTLPRRMLTLPPRNRTLPTGTPKPRRSLKASDLANTLG
jgi:hypothetical protein